MASLIKKANIDPDMKDEYRLNFLATGYNKYVSNELP